VTELNHKSALAGYQIKYFWLTLFCMLLYCWQLVTILTVTIYQNNGMSEHTTVSPMYGKHTIADKIWFKNNQLLLMLHILHTSLHVQFIAQYLLLCIIMTAYSTLCSFNSKIIRVSTLYLIIVWQHNINTDTDRDSSMYSFYHYIPVLAKYAV